MSGTEADPVLNWWQENIAARESGGARGLAARLRRAGVVEALGEAQVHQLGRRIGLRDGRTLANLARLLAEVREDSHETLFRRLGPSSPEADDAALSRLRFQRLLRGEGEEMQAGLRRAIVMADRRCNVSQLARDIRWIDSERTRQRWCFEYFRGDVVAADPKDLTPEET